MSIRSEFPRYSYPSREAAGFLFDLLLGRRCSFRSDAQACLKRLQPPTPARRRKQPFAWTSAPGFQSPLPAGIQRLVLALGIASVVPAEIHFALMSKLTFPGRLYAPLGHAVSQWLLRRIARLYGSITMPPLPPR